MPLSSTSTCPTELKALLKELKELGNINNESLKSIVYLKLFPK
jgi:hypothetical protein